MIAFDTIFFIQFVTLIMDLSDYWKLAFRAFIMLTSIALPFMMGMVKDLNKDYSSNNVSSFFWKTSRGYLIVWLIVCIIIVTNLLYPYNKLVYYCCVLRVTMITMLVIAVGFIVKVFRFQNNSMFILRQLIKKHPRFIANREKFYRWKIWCILRRRTIRKKFSKIQNLKMIKIFCRKNIVDESLYSTVEIFDEELWELDSMNKFVSETLFARTDEILLAITDIACYAIKNKQYIVSNKARYYIKEYLRKNINATSKDMHQVNKQKINEVCDVILRINSALCCKCSGMETESDTNGILILKPLLESFENHEILCKTLWLMFIDMLKHHRTDVIQLSEDHLIGVIKDNYIQFSKVWNILLIFNSLLLDKKMKHLVSSLYKKEIRRIELFDMDEDEFINQLLPPEEQLWWYRMQPWQTDIVTEQNLRNMLVEYYHFIKN